jgi:NTP pyrophosphatase (non-canonical NTP hydrolase)
MDLKELTLAFNRLIELKGWYKEDSTKPQTSRHMAKSISIEAAEILELFQWQDEVKDQEALADELADVTLYCLQLANLNNIDLEEAILAKIKKNFQRHWDE